MDQSSNGRALCSRSRGRDELRLHGLEMGEMLASVMSLVDMRTGPVTAAMCVEMRRSGLGNRFEGERCLITGPHRV